MPIKKIYRRLVHWESWPFGLLYAPLSPFWLWYMIRSGSVWFFTPSNPKITFGGLEGEPKKEMYALLPTDLYPPTFNAQPEMKMDELRSKLREAGIAYPFIVKPEVGWQGVLLRKINSEGEWERYHTQIPEEYIVQQLVTYPLEVSVFYIRHPKEEKGIVTGFLQKIPLHVIGNGVETVGQLIIKDSKASKRMEELKNRHSENWDLVPPAGEKYALSHAANHNRGAQFIDLKEHIDENLVRHFDEISKGINDFFYGRYDIMCSSVDELKQGRNYSILEYNGCGAEPNHFYDTGYTLMGAYKEILRHWKALYTISAYNSRLGIKPWPLMKGIKFLYQTRKNINRLRALDKLLV